MENRIHNYNDTAALLLNAYVKVLRINLSDDTFSEIKVNGDELDSARGYSSKISEWFQGFATTGNVHPEDCDNYNSFTDIDYLSSQFDSGNESVSLRYRRLSGSEFRWSKMTVRKSESYSDSDKIVILYIEDIHDDYLSNIMLKDAFSAAVAASSAKSEFMSRMSHDIRTPLNGIIGMTAIAGAHMDEKEKVADCLSKINSASKHLLSLINDILDLSKIESGKVTLTESEFNLPALVDELLEMTHSAVEDHKHELNVYIENIRHENVIGDRVRLQQIFTNLVSNAIKYTPDHGTINITFTELPSGNPNIGMYRFIVQDNGYGMSEEFVKKLFEPFERADDARIAQIQGTGLGMTITRNIINMMGGDIQVESKENEGSKFTVSFKIKLQDSEIDVVSPDLLDLPVLVVDDDPAICESTCITLGELGMKGDYSLSGADAVIKVVTAHENNEDYYACLIDWKMPDMDGIETTRRIRKAVGPDIPIIIITAYDWNDIEEEARLAGADGFISKPLFKSRIRAAFTDLPQTLRNTDSTHELDDIRSADYSSKRLLLVEDNELNREIATEILTMTGALVESAANGQIALDMFAASAPGYYDCIFMDIRMPVMNGYEAAKAIRAMQRDDAGKVPIIALTANAYVEDIDNALQAGMNKHISKPIDMEQLLAIMDEFLTD